MRRTALGAISGSVKVGQTALLAVVDEPSTDVVAAAMAESATPAARRSVADVEAEIAAAEDAERKAKQEARKELQRQRREARQGGRQRQGRGPQGQAPPRAPERACRRRRRHRRAVRQRTLVEAEHGRHHRDAAVHRGRPRAASSYELRQLGRDRRLQVRGAVLVQRSPQGAIDGLARPAGIEACRPADSSACSSTWSEVPSGSSSRATDGFRGGGGHPAYEPEREIALDQIGRSLEPGITLVVAEVADPEPAALDSALGALGGDVTGRPAREVYAEVRAADEAEKAKLL